MNDISEVFRNLSWAAAFWFHSPLVDAHSRRIQCKEEEADRNARLEKKL